MRNITRFVFAFAFTAFLWGAGAAAEPVHFRVKLDPSVAGGERVSGRLLIFMRRDDGKPSEGFGADFTDPNAVWISGTEITNFTAGRSVEINADENAFPSAFSAAPNGGYQIFALLDRDHSYTYSEMGAGDIRSAVLRAKMPARETDITLSQVVPEEKHEVSSNTRVIDFVSPMLSAFWDRPVSMQASVVLPPKYDSSRITRYPTVYIVHGYGGGYLPPKSAMDTSR
jgi:hypothetical protein